MEKLQDPFIEDRKGLSKLSSTSLITPISSMKMRFVDYWKLLIKCSSEELFSSNLIPISTCTNDLKFQDMLDM